MPTSVVPVQERLLEDGSTITCKPANIATMRKGTAMIEALSEANEEDDDFIHRVLDIVCLCLRKQRPDFEVDVLDDEGNKTGRKVANYELMEEIFDLDTMFKVVEVFLGYKLNDPKLLEAAAQLAAAMQEEEQAGKNSTSQS